MKYFLLPHQDDEYGIYPVLEELTASGQAVAVVYLTSGTLDGSTSRKRNSESARVLRALGLESGQIDFLGSDRGFPDGRLHEHITQAHTALEELIQRRGIPSGIYCPAWEGGHQDHDAANILACRLALTFNCLSQSRQYPLYTGAGMPWILWHTFRPLPGNGVPESRKIAWRSRWRYLRQCLSYRSQWRTWLGLYPPYLAYMMLRGTQYLQPLNPGRLVQSPHPGPPLYERRGFCTAAAFRQHTARVVDEVISC